MQQQPKKVCQCIYHENIDLTCTSLTNVSRSKNLEIDYKSFAMLTIFGKLAFVILFNKDVSGENVKIVEEAEFNNNLCL